MSSNRSTGILEFDTQRYYVKNFGCSHFKGSDIEDNYYLFRPIYYSTGSQLIQKDDLLKLKQNKNSFWKRLSYQQSATCHQHSKPLLSSRIYRASGLKYTFRPRYCTSSSSLLLRSSSIMRSSKKTSQFCAYCKKEWSFTEVKKSCRKCKRYRFSLARSFLLFD